MVDSYKVYLLVSVLCYLGVDGFRLCSEPVHFDSVPVLRLVGFPFLKEP